MPRQNNQLQATAYHEAGHVTANIYLELPFDYVTIIASDGMVGHVQHCDEIRELVGLFTREHDNYKPSIIEKAIIEKSIISDLAAFQAEYKFTGRRNKVKASADWDSARKKARVGRSDNVAEKYLKYLDAAAAEIFEHPFWWNLTEVIAQQLVIKKTLFFCDVQELQKNMKHIIPESDV